jgi:hypothetical protein
MKQIGWSGPPGRGAREVPWGQPPCYENMHAAPMCCMEIAQPDRFHARPPCTPRCMHSKHAQQSNQGLSLWHLLPAT